MATNKAESNIVVYTDKDGRKHHASRTSPRVVKGLASGEYKLVKDKVVTPDAPKVPKPSVAPNPRPTSNGS